MTKEERDEIVARFVKHYGLDYCAQVADLTEWEMLNVIRAELTRLRKIEAKAESLMHTYNVSRSPASIVREILAAGE